MLFQTSSGAKLYYQVYGKGKAIVCFHGNRQSTSYFKPQLPLAEAFQLILIDTLGHGQSSPLREKLTFLEMAKLVKELLDSLGLSDYVLVGHSDGANLAIAFENLFPENVKGLLLNAGNVRFTGLRTHYLLSISLKVFKLGLQSLLNPTLKNAYYVACLMMANQTIVPSKYSNQIPVYVLVGEKDMIRPKHSLFIAKHYSNSRLMTLPFMGHNINKKPDIFNAVIDQLMREAFKVS